MKIAVIPDTHFPYVDRNKLQKSISIIKDFKPDAVIQIGDLYDQLSFSNFPKDPSKVGYSPEQQAVVGKQMAKKMWSDIHKVSPKAKLYQLPGNHDVRIIKRMNQKIPQASFIAQNWLNSQMAFDLVQNVSDQFILDDIMFMHGFRPMGAHAKWNQMNTVTGHTHKARIEYFQNRHGEYWEFNTGWIGDKQAYPFAYRSQKKIDDTQQGIGLIEHRQPRFISL